MQTQGERASYCFHPVCVCSYIGQVDYSTQPDDLEALFKQAGTVARVSIPCNPWSGGPQGFAYLEFTDAAAQGKAIDLFNGHSFKGRELKVGGTAEKREKLQEEYGWSLRASRRGVRPEAGRRTVGHTMVERPVF